MRSCNRSPRALTGPAIAIVVHRASPVVEWSCGQKTKTLYQDGIYDKYILRDDQGHVSEVLPQDSDPSNWAQLSLGLDSGSIGRAAAAFSKHKLCLNIWIYWDILHRLIRDIKLALERCSSVHRAVLHSTFTMSLNDKPFGSGAWFEEKKSMLLFFKSRLIGKSENPYFRHYARKWASDIGEPATTRQDFHNLWTLLDDLPSFQKKLDKPKSMRWFSVNQSMEASRTEHWPLKMILHFYLTEQDDFDEHSEQYIDPVIEARRNPRQELQDLRSRDGGWKLSENADPLATRHKQYILLRY